MSGYQDDMSEMITPPTLDQIEIMARAAMASIPAMLRERTAGIAFTIEEFPSDEILAEMGIESPFDILGFYSGVPFGEKALSGPPADLDRIFLYRRPILDYWCETGEDLLHIVRHVLVHEIGHHFGFSDDDMERIEASSREEQGPPATRSLS
jgi:predicted Zn-dependent protease with MMP-like domain